MKKLVIILAVILVLLIAATAIYLTRPIDLFDTTVRASTVVLTVNPDNIPSFDELIKKVALFPFAKCVDMGNYPIFPEQEEILRATYPDIAFRYQLCKKLCGITLPADTTTIDLSKAKLDSVAELIAQLKNFDKVTEVSFGDNTLKVADRDALVSAYPKITFHVQATLDIYGKEFPEEVESLDLTDITPDDTLADQLAAFRNVRYVDLHGVDLSQSEKYALVKQFPDIEFAWTAKLAGIEFDSTIETINLNKMNVGNLELFSEALYLFPHLKKVEMCDCGLSNEQMEALNAKHPNIKLVWRIYLGQWSLRTDAVAFSVLIVNYQHKRLRTSDVQVLKYCTDLQALDLGHQALTDLSFIADYLPELRILILADNAISDLSPLAQLKHLHYLEFFVNQVRDVSPLAECKELVDLNISYNPISDVSSLMELPLIERFWLEHISVPYAQIQQLKAAYPKATVISEGQGSVDQGWRTHQRYYAMIDMYHKHTYMSESFSKYDGLVFPD